MDEAWIFAATSLVLSIYAVLRAERVSRSTRRRRRLRRKDFPQAEALIALYHDLELRSALPPTRGWAGSPDFLRLLAVHAEREHPRVVVECGSGVSTVVLARALQRNGQGHVYSLEHLPEVAATTRAWLAAQDLTAWASVVDAPLVPIAAGSGVQPWYDLLKLPDLPIDMLVIDGPPGPTAPLARYPAGPMLFPRLAPTATVFLDDANRRDEKIALERWQRDFPDWMMKLAPCEKGAAILARIQA